MSTNRTPANGLLGGFLVPDCCLEVWTAETTIGAASPITSQLVPDRDTKLRVIPSGTPVASDALDILTSTGGVPGGSADFDGGGARFLMRPANETPDADWRGWDPPIALSFIDAFTSGGDTINALSIVVTSDGTEVVCWEEIDTGPALRPCTIFTAQRIRGNTYFEAPVTVYTESAGGAGTSPRIVRTDSGRLDIYALTEETSPQMVIRFSSFDDGATWEQSSTGLVRLEADRLTIQVASGGGQVLLFANSDDGTVRTQYASSDDGNSFEQVDSAQSGHTLAVTYSAGRFIELCYVEIASAGLGSITCLTYGSAFTPGSPETSGETIKSEVGSDPAPVAKSSGSLIVDDTGTIYAYWIPTDTAALTPTMRVYYSVDGGINWETNERNVYVSGATTAPFSHFAVAWLGGTAAIVFAETDVVYWGRLGGWTNRTLPSQYAGIPPGVWSMGRWRSTFIPMDGHGLDDMGADWTESLTATPTIDKNSGFLLLYGTTGDGVEYEYDPGVASDHAMVKIGTGTASGDGLVKLTLRVTTTESTARTFGFTVSLNYDSGTITVRDDSDSSTLYGPVAIPLGEHELFMGIGRSAHTTYSAYLGIRDIDEGEDERIYLHRLDAEPLGAFGSPEASSRFLLICDTSADFDCRITYLLADLQGVTGYGLGRAVGADQLFGMPYSPRPTYVRDGVSIRALGSTNRNDSWSMTPSSYYAVANALPTVLASPKRGHLSSSTTGAAYAFQLTTGGDASRGGLWAIYLDGITYKTATISIYTSSAWTSLGTVSFGMPILCITTEGTLTPNKTSNWARRYWKENELVGCHFEDDDLTVGEIIGNDEGHWDTDGAQAARIRLDTATTAGERGGNIWFTRAVVYMYLADNVEFEGIKIAVASSVNSQNIGTKVIGIGRVRVMGDGFDQTRAVVRELGTRMEELPDGGASAVRVRPDRRSVELSHARSLRIEADAPTGHVRALSGAAAVGSTSDPRTLDGMIGAVGRDPIVYLPKIQVHSGTATTLAVDLGDTGAIYGRFVPDTYRVESVTGHAETGEVVRTSVVTFVEEV